jgi:hypothetical protein
MGRLVADHDKALRKITALRSKLDAVSERLIAVRHELETARSETASQAARLTKLARDRDSQARLKKYLHRRLLWHWASHPETEQAWERRPPGDDPFARRAAWLKAKLVDVLATPAADSPDRGVTAVVTSCGRHDLLVRTLDSFFEVNSCPIARMIVVEDGDRELDLAARRRFSNRPIDWINTGGRVGQIQAIDHAYSRVRTPYIFHIEDDYRFLKPGFIERSLSILEAEPLCLQVWIRGEPGEEDLLAEPHASSGTPWRRIAPHRGVWHGFSFNPGLRRLRDYRLIGSYAANVDAALGRGGLAEAQLSELYGSVGFFAAALWTNGGEAYAKHLGRGRHVE